MSLVYSISRDLASDGGCEIKSSHCARKVVWKMSAIIARASWAVGLAEAVRKRGQGEDHEMDCGERVRGCRFPNPSH